jgi:SAM-dependent methyltransferase
MGNQEWTRLHEHYKGKEWSHQPSLFAEDAIQYFPKEGRVLELGAGLGQDGIFFAEKGFTVTVTDLEATAVEQRVIKLPESLRKNITTQALDLTKPLPFASKSFDVVYAHLSLHYFDARTTEQIFRESSRILKERGIFAFLVNSIHDPEYKTGPQIEDDLFNIEGVIKRYFSTESTKHFTNAFELILLDENGESYKDRSKDIHNLIRFVGKKPSSNKSA